MHTMRIYPTPDGWMLTTSDPEINQWFGTSTIPIIFTPKANPDMVGQTIARIYKEYEVLVRHDLGWARYVGGELVSAI